MKEHQTEKDKRESKMNYYDFRNPFSQCDFMMYKCNKSVIINFYHLLYFVLFLAIYKIIQISVNTFHK